MRIFALCSLVLSFGLAGCVNIEDPFETLTSISATDFTTGLTTSTTGTTGTTAEDPTTGTTAENPTTGMTGTSMTGSTTNEPATSTTNEPATSTTNEPGTTGSGTTMGGGGDDPYVACDPMGMCPAGGDCVMVQGLDGSFCSPKCDGDMCPDFGGAAQPMCVLQLEGMTPSNCALICNPMAMGECPDGATCTQVPMQQVGVCTFP